MSTPSRTSSDVSGGAAAGLTFRVAIVGAGTLKGKEVKDAIEQGSFPAVDVKLLDDAESLGQLEAVGEEPTFIQSVEPEQFAHLDFAFFASEPGFTRRHAKLARDAGTAVIDLSYALEDAPGSVVRAPWIEREAGRSEPASDIVVVGHPAAIMLALLLLRARRAAGLRSAVATVFEPASERGRRAVDELHQQTVNLFSFHPLPTAVFDAQVAFNLLTAYGAKAEPALESVEHRIRGHLRRLVGDAVDVPSLVLVQAPTFHGYVVSLYIDFGRKLSPAELAAALAGEHLTVVPDGDEGPSNVGAAGQETIQVSLRPDAVHENAYWLWAVADNLRLAAVTAVDCAAELGKSRGTPR